MSEALWPVSGLAHMFLGIESEKYPMDGAAMLMLDPSTAADGYGFAEVRGELAARIPATILGRRLVRFPPFGPSYATAYWAPDAKFDIDRHLFTASVAPPGDLYALAALTLELSEGALPRDRPLWRAWLVDGFTDGRLALIIRLHHAAVDGLAGMALFGTLFDREPTPAGTLAQARQLPGPRRGSVLRRSVPALAASPLKSLRAGVALGRTLAAGRGAADGAQRGRIFRDAAPDCLFNRVPSSPERSLALLEVPMEKLKAIKNRHGITITDLVLALVTGALRTYLAERDEAVDQPLAAMCPMSVRTDTEATNSFVMMVNRLPVQLEEPLARLAAIHAETVASKRVAQAEATVGDSAALVANALPPLTWSVMRGLPDAVLKRMPALANLEVSSIPGPPFPLYLAGAEVTTMHARTFVQRGSGLFISAMSYAGTMFIAVTAIRELVPDPERLAAGIEAEMMLLASSASRERARA
jgi:diacylglycerol O-acyltransferase